MKCPACHRSMEEDAIACPSCGARCARKAQPRAACEYGPCGRSTMMSQMIGGRRVNICEDCWWVHRFQPRAVVVRSTLAPREWARRILDRRRAGELLPHFVVACALGVTGDAPAPRAISRQPGEDDSPHGHE